MQSAGVTPRQLPARQFLSLDTLVSRATAAPSTRVARKPAARQGASAAFDSRARQRVLVEETAGEGERHVKPATPPSALALWITVATCTCGRVHRSPSPHVLIKYAENEHSFHYTRDDAALAEHMYSLPREVREKAIRIPFCEECFAPSRSDAPASSREP